MRTPSLSSFLGIFGPKLPVDERKGVSLLGRPKKIHDRGNTHNNDSREEKKKKKEEEEKRREKKKKEKRRLIVEKMSKPFISFYYYKNYI